MPTSLSDAMQTIAAEARRRAGGQHHDPRSRSRPPSSRTLKAARTAIPEPDSVGDAVLRWGQYVVDKLSPEPGDVFLVKGPRGEDAAEKREKMGEALEHCLREQGIEDYLILRGPAMRLSIHQLSEQQMRELGYERAGTPDPAAFTGGD